MATNTGTIVTYEQVGIKEDISDIITNISPTKTPFQACIGTEKVWNTLYQWQEDSLFAAGSNAQVEGAAAPTASSQPTVMRTNVTQILTKTAAASGTTDAVRTYGRERELAYQLAMRSAEIKRDLEYAMVGVNQASVAGSASVARQMASALSMISNTGIYTMGDGLNYTGVLPASQVITEAAFLATVQQLYNVGGEPNTLLVKPADGVNVSAWQSSSRTVMVENGQKKLTNVIDVYESPFGKINVVLDRFILASSALVFEPTMWKRAVLRNWTRETLAKTGDSTTVMILGEFGLKHRNFEASGALVNLT